MCEQYLVNHEGEFCYNEIGLNDEEIYLLVFSITLALGDLHKIGHNEAKRKSEGLLKVRRKLLCLAEED